MSGRRPSRGEVWWADFDPVVGHEQSGDRPALIISSDLLNHGPSGQVIAVPFARTLRPLPVRIRVDPPEGGIVAPSVIMCDHMRAISTLRLRRYSGQVSRETVAAVEDALRILMDL